MVPGRQSPPRRQTCGNPRREDTPIQVRASPAIMALSSDSAMPEVEAKPGRVDLLLFFLAELCLADDFLLHVAWHNLVVRELHRKAALAGGHAGQRAGISGHFAQGDFAANRLISAAGIVRSLHAAAPACP